jgi:hypothetical protein
VYYFVCVSLCFVCVLVCVLCVWVCVSVWVGAQNELASYRVEWQASIRAFLTDRNILTSNVTLLSCGWCNVDITIKHYSWR